ncbi:hypothetical protein [Roseinatronobacter alkalisoli]|uniref:Uncharacterized protein n=1 Tax=Roseinatronobacter alkalisoli TaxID=3028235 RepID=A0ABT5T6W5_9RHOB|nr:hypothetical protein [Roseinatronobacter sp. HJB301]MDD7970868.1 hypothetical protein [Roseinatronobacter sp. HJB301]
MKNALVRFIRIIVLCTLVPGVLPNADMVAALAAHDTTLKAFQTESCARQSLRSERPDTPDITSGHDGGSRVLLDWPCRYWQMRSAPDLLRGAKPVFRHSAWTRAPPVPSG